MTVVKETLTQDAIKQLASSLDKIFIEALNKHAPGWTMLDVANRCRLISHVDWKDGREVFYVDGKPIAEVWPIETVQRPTDDSFVIEIIQRYRIL